MMGIQLCLLLWDLYSDILEAREADAGKRGGDKEPHRRAPQKDGSED